MTHKLIAAIITITALSGCASNRDISRHFPEVIALRDAGQPIYIMSSGSSGANSVGGVSFYVQGTLLGDRPAKYIHFDTSVYNAVGDQVTDDIRGTSRRTAYATGPHRPDKIRTFNWPRLWYNHSIKCVEIEEIRITYADDEVLTIGREQVDEIMMYSRRPNTCAVDIE